MPSSSRIYERLGIKPIINAQGTYTTLGGSLMPPEVLSAMAEAAEHFVSMPELQQNVGERIAALLGVPAAMVTAGAAAAIAVATSACLARSDERVLKRLPDTTGISNEVIVQTAHQDGYEPQILLTGARIVNVETVVDLERAIGPKTAMLYFTNCHEPRGQIKRAEWLRIARSQGIPTLLDAAADVPPISRFQEYHLQGFDLVTFSGGKAIRGPQASGLLLGDANLIGLARQVISPHMGLGRSMKVAKEEVVGLLVALERFLAIDHDTEQRQWQTRADEMTVEFEKLQGLTARIALPEIANHSPHIVLDWSRQFPLLESELVVQRLRQGDPPIAILAEGRHGLRIAVWTLRDDEHKRVVARVLEELRGSSV